jgi:hypothetical protein
VRCHARSLARQQQSGTIDVGLPVSLFAKPLVNGTRPSVNLTNGDHSLHQQQVSALYLHRPLFLAASGVLPTSTVHSEFTPPDLPAQIPTGSIASESAHESKKKKPKADAKLLRTKSKKPST